MVGYNDYINELAKSNVGNGNTLADSVINFLIVSELAKNGINITSADYDTKYQEYEKTLLGERSSKNYEVNKQAVFRQFAAQTGLETFMVMIGEKSADGSKSLTLQDIKKAYEDALKGITKDFTFHVNGGHFVYSGEAVAGVYKGISEGKFTNTDFDAVDLFNDKLSSWQATVNDTRFQAYTPQDVKDVAANNKDNVIGEVVNSMMASIQAKPGFENMFSGQTQQSSTQTPPPPSSEAAYDTYIKNFAQGNNSNPLFFVLSDAIFQFDDKNGTASYVHNKLASKDNRESIIKQFAEQLGVDKSIAALNGLTGDELAKKIEEIKEQISKTILEKKFTKNIELTLADNSKISITPAALSQAYGGRKDAFGFFDDAAEIEKVSKDMVARAPKLKTKNYWDKLAEEHKGDFIGAVLGFLKNIMPNLFSGQAAQPPAPAQDQSNSTAHQQQADNSEYPHYAGHSRSQHHEHNSFLFGDRGGNIFQRIARIPSDFWHGVKENFRSHRMITNREKNAINDIGDLAEADPSLYNNPDLKRAISDMRHSRGTDREALHFIREFIEEYKQGEHHIKPAEENSHNNAIAGGGSQQQRQK